MRSSAKRERCAISSAPQPISSMTKSRSATASSELPVGRAKPRSAASASRSTPNGLPESAPEPSGHSFIRATIWARRSPSRFHAHACESIQWPQRIGCADCRWVYPGIRMSTSARARTAAVRTSVFNSSPSDAHTPRRWRRRSVTTWSFRLRPVCTLPPGAPISSVSRRSFAVWMSSSPSLTANVPASHSPRTCSSPPRIAAPSSAEIVPAFSSARL